MWSKQFGTSASDKISDFAIDKDKNVYAVGTTYGGFVNANLGAHDVFVRKYRNDGEIIWTKQFGTVGFDYAEGAKTDEDGNLFVVGGTSDRLAGKNYGQTDAFVYEYDKNGNIVWIDQFGSKETDIAQDLIIDNQKHLFIIGNSRGDMSGKNAGGNDIFIRKYQLKSGNSKENDLIFEKMFGEDKEDIIHSATSDSLGNIYIGGYTESSLFGSNFGYSDVFIGKYRFE